MDNSGRNNVVYSLVQRDGNVGVRRHHEKGFWEVVFDNFEKDMGGTIREYDAIVSKWKSSIRPKVAAFSDVYDGVQRMDENGFRLRSNEEPRIIPDDKIIDKSGGEKVKEAVTMTLSKGKTTLEETAKSAGEITHNHDHDEPNHEL
ncbi:hypothetical protein Tco_0064796 [Tanacetum coccineum]